LDFNGRKLRHRPNISCLCYLPEASNPYIG
jgi:hypothetical protein